MPKTKHRSYRLSDDAAALVEELARQQGTSKTAQLELAIRDRAKAHGITALALADTPPQD